MAPQTPLVFVDNILDVTTLYPGATLGATSSLTGREPYRAIDARRERSWWQAATVATNHALTIDMGSGKTATPDTIFIDRGHNAWNHAFQIGGGTDGVTFPTTVFSRSVPALNADGSYPVGGDPSSAWCVTEEGAIYTFITSPVAKRNFELLFPDSMQPVIPGAMLGVRTQLLGYSSVRDEDAMMRSDISEQSRALYRGTDRRYTARTLLISLKYIGATEYDSTQRNLRRLLFELDQPAVIAMDWGTKPERAWMYQYDGTTYSAPMNRTYRGIEYRMREVGPLVR